MNKPKVNFWVDAGLFVVLVVLIVLHEGALVTVHQVAGIVLAIGAAVHVVLHGKWITTMVRRWRQNLPRAARRNAVIVALLALAFTWTLVSGLAISPLIWGDQASTQLAHAHLMGGVFTLVFLSAHLILHRKWIGHGIKRHILGVYTFESAPPR